MKPWKNRILAGSLSAVMLAGMLPASLAAETGLPAAPEAGAVSEGLKESGQTPAYEAPNTETNVFEAATEQELSQAIAGIQESGVQDAVIVLKQSISNAAAPFSGVEKVHITLRSAEGQAYSIKLAPALNGPVTLDNVRGDWGEKADVYANGHLLETTKEFALAEGSSVMRLFGGGDSSTACLEGTNLVLAGGTFRAVFGGGNASPVTGDTHVTIDGAEVSGIVGGGYGEAPGEGTVNGSTYVTVRSGVLAPMSSTSMEAYNRYIYAGGYNQSKAETASVAAVTGDTHLTFGGGTDGDIVYGPRYGGYHYYAGAYYAAVEGNTHLTLLPGSRMGTNDDMYPKLYGGGEGDAIHGCAEIAVSGGENLVWTDGAEHRRSENGIWLYLGGDATSEIRNENHENYAVTLTMTGGALARIYGTRNETVYSGDEYSGIAGDVKMDLSGSSTVARLEGSYRTRAEDANPTSAAHITVSGNDAVIRHFSGCEALTFRNMGTEAMPAVVRSVQYTNLFTIQDSYLNIGSSYWDPSDTAKSECMPWVKDLVLKNTTLNTEPNAVTTIADAKIRQGGSYTKGEGGSVTIQNSTWNANHVIDIWGDMTLDSGTLVIKSNWIQSYTPSLNTIHGNFTSKDGALYINAVEPNVDYGNPKPFGSYTGSNPSGPMRLQIGGEAGGSCDVYIMERGSYPALHTPAVGDNYLVAKKGDLSAFRLANPDAITAGMIFKNVNGRYFNRYTGGPGSYENAKVWQVATGITVTFDQNNSDPQSTGADPGSITKALPKWGTAVKFDTLPTPPSRPGYLFEGWNTKADGSGDVFGTDTPVSKSMTVYAQWKPEKKLYTVTFAPGGHGTLEGTASFQITEGTTMKDCAYAVPALHEDSGYTFTGWLGNDGTLYSGEQVLALTVTGNLTFTAQYRKNPSDDGTIYDTLHYESNGGTEYRDEQYGRNTLVSLDKVPLREGYLFTGWYADKALTEKISSVRLSGSRTVYAGWRKSTVPDMLNGDDHFAYVVGYVDGTVKPLNHITRSEVAAIFFRLLDPEIRDQYLTDVDPFEDVSADDWYHKEVSTLNAMGIFHGKTETVFDGCAPITRGEFASVCARFDTKETAGSSGFTDIAGHWAEAEIQRAAALGWIMGYPDGTFRPDQPITRAEAMTMINRVLNRIPENEDDLLPDMNVWPDNQPDAWYYTAVQEATNTHDYVPKGEIHESWTEMLQDPDWTQYR